MASRKQTYLNLGYSRLSSRSFVYLPKALSNFERSLPIRFPSIGVCTRHPLYRYLPAGEKKKTKGNEVKVRLSNKTKSTSKGRQSNGPVSVRPSVSSISDGGPGFRQSRIRRAGGVKSAARLYLIHADVSAVALSPVDSVCAGARARVCACVFTIGRHTNTAHEPAHRGRPWLSSGCRGL